ncbi:hypothetical protein CFP65_7254 [Kitasatospora sp. MMS16-BH015]|uniref:hypothetical protein n=1 Tax=Kitasatospora sp. MMS16-BH015 TaxID=2018025 RepID=UPI000CA2DAE7|nr:hypothetical protein [Kitasatospora sp. MMS16-BH015]AUG81841.1 hypothetical protein CFP65_7254 [Kitasatospora sp. MMS16-BH015]
MTADPATVPASAPARDSVLRQRVLVLYLLTSALDSEVLGWSQYDGTGRTSPTTGDGAEPPYSTGLDALKDGWRLIQAAQLLPPHPGHEYEVSFLKHEFFFERIERIDQVERPPAGE